MTSSNIKHILGGKCLVINYRALVSTSEGDNKIIGLSCFHGAWVRQENHCVLCLLQCISHPLPTPIKPKGADLKKKNAAAMS